MKKRIPAALLSVVLCLALLSTTVFAATTPTVTVSGTSGGTSVTVSVSNLTPNTGYQMCSIMKGDVLLALFDLTTDNNGNNSTTVNTGPLADGDHLTVNIPKADGGSAASGSTIITGKPTPPSTPYTITVSAGAGGSISPNGTMSYAAGATPTYTITADSGYSISDVTVDSTSVGAVRTYTFAALSDSHTIAATFSKDDQGGGGGGGGGGGSGGGGGGGGSSSTNSPKVTKNTGGTVKVSSDGKTVTITPKDGYRVKDVIINGESMGAITKYVFDKASKNNTVEVIFEKITTGETPNDNTGFNDVSGHWAADAISFVVERGLFNGTSANTFSPNAAMTRSMLATVLYRLAGEPATSGASTFPDVPAGQWYSSAVAWAAQNGIVNGTGTGFAPNGNITREQLAAMLYRYCVSMKGNTSVSKTLNFPDAGKVSPWASDAMSWAVGAGIINGTDTSALNPGGNATRAEVATMLMRFVNFLG